MLKIGTRTNTHNWDPNNMVILSDGQQWSNVLWQTLSVWIGAFTQSAVCANPAISAVFVALLGNSTITEMGAEPMWKFTHLHVKMPCIFLRWLHARLLVVSGFPVTKDSMSSLSWKLNFPHNHQPLWGSSFTLMAWETMALKWWDQLH